MPRPDSSPASSTRSRDRAKTCPPPTSKSNDVSHIQELEKLRDAPIPKNPISKGRLAQCQSDQQTMQMAAGRVSERLVFETCIFAFACARSGACSSSPQLNGGPPRAGQVVFDPDVPSVTSTALLAMKPVRMWCPAASMKEPPREVVSHPCHRDGGPGVDMRIFVSAVIQGPGRSTCMGSGERWRAGGETGTPGVVQKEAWPRGFRGPPKGGRARGKGGKGKPSGGGARCARGGARRFCPVCWEAQAPRTASRRGEEG